MASEGRFATYGRRPVMIIAVAAIAFLGGWVIGTTFTKILEIVFAKMIRPGIAESETETWDANSSAITLPRFPAKKERVEIIMPNIVREAFDKGKIKNIGDIV